VWCCACCQAGLARFPGDPTVLLVYANYIIHVKKEPRAARQQLQLASKGEPNLIERYNIFSANVGLPRFRYHLCSITCIHRPQCGTHVWCLACSLMYQLY
jgi:hypothetical protein